MCLPFVFSFLFTEFGLSLAEYLSTKLLKEPIEEVKKEDQERIRSQVL